MITRNKNLVLSQHPPRLKLKDQAPINKNFLCLIMIILMPFTSSASFTCHGHFVNPLSDVCWGCVPPLNIGGFSIGKGSSPKKRDTKNPSSPICACTKGGVPMVPGISIGFWEPVRLVDVTRTPYCMVNLGGIELGSDKSKISAHSRGRGGNGGTHSSFYHVHYYVYPLIYWLELITDFACLETGTFDLAYMSEFDVTWNDPKLQGLLNPESILFANPLAHASCALDCASATISMPIDSMFWCAGCLGSMYPFSGANGAHVGGVKTSSLLVTRILAKMHRVGLAQETSTSSARIDGPICRKSRAFKIKKSQYKLQMVNPKTTSGGIGCWPLGLTDMMYSAFKEYPYDGEDWGYLIWRKKNCCLL